MELKNKQAGMHLQAEDVAIPEVLVDGKEGLDGKEQTALEMEKEASGEEDEAVAEIDYNCAIPEIHISHR